MEVCSFLSTCDERVDCFKGCPFYCHEEDYSECPFKSVTGKSKQNVRKLYQYYYAENYGFGFDEEIEARLID
jgi:hypothetical protein